MPSRILGALKVSAVLILDLSLFLSLFHSPAVAAAGVIGIGIYTFLGGYFALVQEGGVRLDKLPHADRLRLETALRRLTDDRAAHGDRARLRLYLIPGDSDLQSTAYGAFELGVQILYVAGLVTKHGAQRERVRGVKRACGYADAARAVGGGLQIAVAGDEVEPQPCAVAGLSVLSAAAVLALFLIFLILSCFRSWLGLFAFHGARKGIKSLFSLLQKAIVLLYQAALGLVSRRAEFRADRYVCRLGYGLQLAHFLSLSAPGTSRPLTLREALYRSHPDTHRRIARIEAYLASAPEAITRR